MAYLHRIHFAQIFFQTKLFNTIKTKSNTQFVAWLWIRIDWTSTKNWWSYSSYRSLIKPLFSAKIEPGALHPPLFSWRHNPPRPTSRLLFLPFADSKAAVMFWICSLLFCCCWFAIDFPIRIDDDESMDWEDGLLTGTAKTCAHEHNVERTPTAFSAERWCYMGNRAICFFRPSVIYSCTPSRWEKNIGSAQIWSIFFLYFFI